MQKSKPCNRRLKYFLGYKPVTIKGKRKKELSIKYYLDFLLLFNYKNLECI